MPGLLRATAKYEKQVPPSIRIVAVMKYILEEFCRTKLINMRAITEKMMKVGAKHKSNLNWMYYNLVQ